MTAKRPQCEKMLAFACVQEKPSKKKMLLRGNYRIITGILLVVLLISSIMTIECVCGYVRYTFFYMM